MYDFVKAYPVASTCPAPYGESGPVLCNSAFQTSQTVGYAPMPSVSSNGASDGLVWVIDSGHFILCRPVCVRRHESQSAMEQQPVRRP